jgi:hypothetical protein
MRISMKAEFVAESEGVVTMEFPELAPACLTNVSFLEMMDPETGKCRKLDRDEERDLEIAMERFMSLRLAKALAPYLIP